MFPFDEDGQRIGLICGNSVLFAGTTLARAEDLENCPRVKPSSKDRKLIFSFAVYRLQNNRQLNNGPKEMTHVARIVVPVFIATRVQKVCEQRLSTRELNGHVRKFQ